MRIWILFAPLLIASAAKAELHPASAADLESIEFSLNGDVLAEGEAAQAESKLQEALSKVPSVDWQAITSPHIQELRAAAKAKSEALEISRIRTAREIMVAYGIVDNSSGLALMPRGQSEYSALPRREIRWGVFCRPGHVVRSYLKDGRALEVELPSPEVVRGEKTIWGVTSPQGHTNLSPALFRRSPSDSDWSWQIAFLAAVLYHEKLHFEQYTDPARANLDFDALEIDAYSRERAALPSMGLPSAHAERIMAFVSGKISAHRRARAMKASPISTYGEASGLEVGNDSLEMDQLADRFDQEVEDALAAERADAAERAARRRAAEEAAARATARRRAAEAAAALEREESERNSESVIDHGPPQPTSRRDYETRLGDDLAGIRASANSICQAPSLANRYVEYIARTWGDAASAIRWLQGNGGTPLSMDDAFSGLGVCPATVLRDIVTRLGEGRWANVLLIPPAVESVQQKAESFTRAPAQVSRCVGLGCKSEGPSAPSSDPRDVGRLGPAYGQAQNWRPR